MSTASVRAMDDTTPQDDRRDQEILQHAVRRWRDTEKARTRYEAALVTRDAALQRAMDNGWTSAELADLVGVRAIRIRNMLSRRRKGIS